MKWQKTILSMIQARKDKKIALAIDTSTKEVQTILINNIVKLFETVKPDTLLVQADFKIRSIAPVKADTIKYQTHNNIILHQPHFASFEVLQNLKSHYH